MLESSDFESLVVTANARFLVVGYGSEFLK